MEWKALSFTVPFWISLLVMLSVAAYSANQRRIPGSRPLIILTLLGALWAAGSIMEALSPGLDRKVFWDGVQMLAGAIGSALFAFCLQFTNPAARFPRWLWVLLAVEPVTIWLLALTAPGLFQINPVLKYDAPFPYLTYTFGPASWVDFIYGYGLSVFAMAMLVRSFVQISGLFRAQAGIMLLGMLVPAVGFLLSISNLLPAYMRDPSSLTLGFLALALAFGVYRYRMFNIAPAARRILFDELSAGLIVLDASGRVIDMNPAALQLLAGHPGLESTGTEEEAAGMRQMVGRPVREVLPHLHRLPVESGEQARREFELNLTNGEGSLHLEVRLSPIRTAGELAGWLVTLYDVTRYRRMEREVAQANAELSESQQQLAGMFEGHSAVMYTVDPDTLRITNANRAALQFYGYTLDEITRLRLPDLSLLPEEQVREEIRRELREGREPHIIKHRLASGEVRDVEIRSTAIQVEGVVRMHYAIVHDVTERIRAQEALQQMATRDALTGLVNRGQFFMLAERELERSRRYKHPLSVIMIDLDNFKRINDIHGHAVGDQALRGAAHSMASVLRASDVLARHGGEEFVILLPETGVTEAVAVAERVRAAVEARQAGGLPVEVSASLGVSSLRPGEDESIDQLLTRADRALYQAKGRGRNRVEIEE